MKLSEALSLRADLQRKIGQLKRRLCSCVKVQEGNDPIEDPVELRKELDRCFEQLEELVYRINYTNLVTERNGVSITKMIAQRDTLTLRVAVVFAHDRCCKDATGNRRMCQSPPQARHGDSGHQLDCRFVVRQDKVG